MSITEKSRFGQIRRNWSSRFRAWRLDRKNRKVYGPEAPAFAERIWVPVEEIQWRLKHWNSKQSGRVVTEWPDEKCTLVSEQLVIQACHEHWIEGASWEDTGQIDRMMQIISDSGKVDKLRSLSDVRTRYHQLDEIFEQVKREQKFRTRQSLVKGCFREEGGILVHIGPDGAPYFGGKGHHRLALALCAGVKVIPAQIGVVHEQAIEHLARYRRAPQSG